MSKKNKKAINLWNQNPNRPLLFTEQEKVFRERTGSDFSTLYKKYYPKLIYYTSRICKDVQKAEDISTDSFIIALEKN
jgi:DNA-directed RNA polymerase specialized sigma24 family protein